MKAGRPPSSSKGKKGSRVNPLELHRRRDGSSGKESGPNWLCFLIQWREVIGRGYWGRGKVLEGGRNTLSKGIETSPTGRENRKTDHLFCKEKRKKNRRTLGADASNRMTIGPRESIAVENKIVHEERKLHPTEVESKRE